MHAWPCDFERDGGGDVERRRRDLMRLQRRDLRLRRAERLVIEAVRPPALQDRELAHEPFGLIADRCAGHDFAFEVGDGLVWRVGPGGEGDAERRAGGFGDREDRRALGDERHARAAADRHIDRASAVSLLLLGVAEEARDFDLEPVLGEDAFLDAEIDRRELEQARERLAETDFVLCLRVAGEQRHRQHRQRESPIEFDYFLPVFGRLYTAIAGLVPAIHGPAGQARGRRRLARLGLFHEFYGQY